MLVAIRRILVLLVVTAVVGGAALALSDRSTLQHDDDAVAAAWRPVRAALADRWTALAALDEAVRTAGPRRDVSSDYERAAARQRSAAAKGPAEQISAANDLDGIGRRFGALVNGSKRYADVTAVTDALRAFEAAGPSDALVATLDDAVDRANAHRDGVLRRLVAGLLGHDDLPRYAG